MLLDRATRKRKRGIVNRAIRLHNALSQTMREMEQELTLFQNLYIDNGMHDAAKSAEEVYQQIGRFVEFRLKQGGMLDTIIKGFTNLPEEEL